MRDNNNLKQLIGFILFWIAVGMLFMLFVRSNFIGVLIAVGFILVGYNLFCERI